MRKKGSKGKTGKRGRCPKCNYSQRVKTRLMNVCCSNCGRKSSRSKWNL